MLKKKEKCEELLTIENQNLVRYIRYHYKRGWLYIPNSNIPIFKITIDEVLTVKKTKNKTSLPYL